MEKIKKPVNTNSNETHATLSHDGESLYFVSDRDGGKGGKDIYKAKLMKDSTWGKVQILSSKINTSKDEATPFITKDNTLYFSSKGHNTMGGYDIFYSKKDGSGNNWGKPENIGYPLNTTKDDKYFAPVNNGKYGYIQLLREEGYGEFDIYKITFEE